MEHVVSDFEDKLLRYSREALLVWNTQISLARQAYDQDMASVEATELCIEEDCVWPRDGLGRRCAPHRLIALKRWEARKNDKSYERKKMKAGQERVLRIGVGNIFGGNPEMDKVPGRIRSLWCDSFGINEGYKLVKSGDLKKMRNYRLRVGMPNRRVGTASEHRIPAHDVPMVIRLRNEMMGWHSYKVSDTVEPVRVGIERWINVSMYHHPIAEAHGARGICHINIHPVAGPQQLIGEKVTPLTRAYGGTTDAVHHELKVAAGLNLLSIVTGDVQVGIHAPRRSWSIYPMLEHHHMDIFVSDLMVIASDARLKSVNQIEIPPSRTGADHNWLVEEFR